MDSRKWDRVVPLRPDLASKRIPRPPARSALKPPMNPADPSRDCKRPVAGPVLLQSLAGIPRYHGAYPLVLQ